MNIYKRAERKSDFLSFHIEQNPDVFESMVSEKEVVLKNNLNDRFLVLGTEEYFIWREINSKGTIKDIIVAYFLEYGKYCQRYVVRVIHEFHINGFLKTQPRNIYVELSGICENKSFRHKLGKIARLFFSFRIELRNLDSLLTVAFDKFFRVFFNRVAFLFYVLLTSVGGVLLIKMLLSNQYSVFEVGNSAVLGSVAAIFINLILASIHEAAHAFTTKYFGQKVMRGGLLLYLGLPCLYVDTNEIWLSGRKARIAVSFAGPWSTAIVGSGCAVFIFLFPTGGYNEILYKLVIWGFVGAIVNLNPLLMLDGYYILIDWAKKPMLRARALTYVRNLMTDVIFQKPTGKLQWDKIIYGALASIWSVASVAFVLFIIELRGERIIRDFFGAGSLLIKVAGALVLAFWMLPVVISIAFFVALKVRDVSSSLWRASILQRPSSLLILFLIVSSLIQMLPEGKVFGGAFLCVAVVYFAWRYRFLEGSVPFSLVKVNLTIALLHFAINVPAIWRLQLLAAVPEVYVRVAFQIICASGFLVILRSFFSAGKYSFLLLMVPLPVVACIQNVRSGLIVPVLLFFTIVLLEAEIVFSQGRCFSLAGHDTAESDLGKLVKIIERSSQSICQVLLESLSNSAMKEVIKKGRQSGFDFIENKFTPRNEVSKDVITLSSSGRKLLSDLLFAVRRFSGQHYSYRLTVGIFYSLFWSEKEIFDRYLFPEKDLMGISSIVREGFNRLDFLHSVVLFSSFDREELRRLADHLQIRKVRQGVHVIREGEIGDEFFIILEGEIDVYRAANKQKKHLATLYEKDFFGEVALLRNCPRTAGALARHDSVLLSLDRKTFGGFVGRYPGVFSKIDQSVRVLSFLKAVPFFRNCHDRVTGLFSSEAVSEKTRAGDKIISQGVLDNDFYIIRGGKFRVLKKDASGETGEIATLVAGEFFGEGTFFSGDRFRVASATVQAMDDGELLRIPREKFREILKGVPKLRSEFELIASRRELENRYRARV